MPNLFRKSADLFRGFTGASLLSVMLLTLFLEGCGWSPSARADRQTNVTSLVELPRIRFSRWDGGPVEARKGELTGWPYFVPPDPDVITATENLYNPHSIDLIVAGNLNWIWVTWSVGFSNETEKQQQEALRSYIRECHRRGINVMAYMSIGNIFWEDMFANVPASRKWILFQNGQPVPYPGANYAAVGGVTRYMADLQNQDWQKFILERVIAAVSAGADGVVFDNNLDLYGRESLERFTAAALEMARQINPQILICSNYHYNLAIAARAENAITSEDGLEPGVFPDAGAPADTWNSTPFFIDVSKGKLALNAGLLRALAAVAESSRPVLLEYGNRHVGDRFVTILSPKHQQLAMAEAATFHASMAQFHESKVLRDLIQAEPSATENWAEVAGFNSFLDQNAALFGPVMSVARVAVVVEHTLNDIVFLNRLAASNVIYDVVFEEDVTSEVMNSYTFVIAAPSVRLTPGMQRLSDTTPEMLTAASIASLNAPDTVLMNVQSQPARNLILIHLLNYDDDSAKNVVLAVKGSFAKATLVSPTAPPTSIPLVSMGNYTQIEIPDFSTYVLLVLEQTSVSTGESICSRPFVDLHLARRGCDDSS